MLLVAGVATALARLEIEMAAARGGFLQWKGE